MQVCVNIVSRRFMDIPDKFIPLMRCLNAGADIDFAGDEFGELCDVIREAFCFAPLDADDVMDSPNTEIPKVPFEF